MDTAAIISRWSVGSVNQPVAQYTTPKVTRDSITPSSSTQ